MLDLGPLVLGTVLTLAAVTAALVVARRADSPWAPVAVVGGGTVLGLAALALAISATTSATDGGNTETAEAATVASTEPTDASTAVGDATPSESPTPQPTDDAAVVTSAGGAPPPTRYIDAPEGGIRWRSDCAADALLGGWWPNGTAVEAMPADRGDCSGWSMVRSGSLVSWVSNEMLADTLPEAVVATETPTAPTATATVAPFASTPPLAAATAAPTSTPRPPAVQPPPDSAFGSAVSGWLTRLRDVDTALEANFRRAVENSDWAGHAAHAERLGTAAVTVRTEIEQLAPFIEDLAPGCHSAATPLGEMASALHRLADAYEQWLASGLVENEAGLRVGEERSAVAAAAGAAAAALPSCL